MRYLYRFIILTALVFAKSAYALEFFVDALEWRATETNDWAYVNSLSVPNQTIDYKTIDFAYTPGFRIGARYNTSWDALFSYTRFYTTIHDATVGNIQPAFLGAVTVKPSHAYLYTSGQVYQAINYNIFDLNVGKKFYPASSLMLHPLVGLMGGYINQSINANYQGSSTAAIEKLSNDFTGIGPKVGLDTAITLFNYHDYQPQLIAALATSYVWGYWSINDVTYSNTHSPIFNSGNGHSMGALNFQGLFGLQLEHKQLSLKLAYELNDWLDQCQFFDNDTGAHNNDLILQGLSFGLAYKFS